MLDTIDMLEAIGQDAVLRYTPGDELVETPALVEASEALRTAILKADRSELTTEFGPRIMQLVQSNQGPGPAEEEESPEQEEEDEPAPGLSFEPRDI